MKLTLIILLSLCISSANAQFEIEQNLLYDGNVSILDNNDFSAETFIIINSATTAEAVILYPSFSDKIVLRHLREKFGTVEILEDDGIKTKARILNINNDYLSIENCTLYYEKGFIFDEPLIRREDRNESNSSGKSSIILYLINDNTEDLLKNNRINRRFKRVLNNIIEDIL